MSLSARSWVSAALLLSFTGVVPPASASTISADIGRSASAFGVSINSASDVSSLSHLLGRPLATVRIFRGSLGGSWSDQSVLRAVPPTATVSLSFTGGSPAAVRSFLAGHPAGTRCYATYHHEPEATFTSNAQQALYRTTWHTYAPAIREAGCIPTLVLMKWTLQPASGRNWRDWYSLGDIDALGFDAYNSQAKKGGYGDAADYLAPILALHTQTGLPWALTEMGSDIPAGTTSAQRAAWAHSVAVAAAAAPGFTFAAWWDILSNSGRDYRLDSNAAQAWHP